VNYALIDTILKAHEGESLTVYLDTRGFDTVGIGHKVLPEDKLFPGDTITKERSAALYLSDRQKAVDAARRLAPKFDTFPDPAQAGLVDMIFNMGEKTVSEMTNTLALINKQDWTAVAAKIDSSAFDKWRNQVGERVEEVSNLFATAKTAIPLVILLITAGIIWYIIKRS
jgi:GH24 family phage-related lysozyme (muramidase)